MKLKQDNANPFWTEFLRVAGELGKEMASDSESGINLVLVDELECKLGMIYRQMKAWRPR